jgi:hypothetical protein
MRLCAVLIVVAQKTGTGFEIRTPIQVAIDRVQSVVRMLTTSMKWATTTATSGNLFAGGLDLKNNQVSQKISFSVNTWKGGGNGYRWQSIRRWATSTQSEG